MQSPQVECILGSKNQSKNERVCICVVASDDLVWALRLAMLSSALNTLVLWAHVLLSP